MPLFSNKDDESHKDILTISSIDDFSVSTSSRNVESKSNKGQKATFSFPCQLASCDQIKIITNFRNIEELHARVAECFDIDSNEILFCTLNTHKVDMEHLLGSQIGLDDFIFVHIEGQKKEIDLYKSEESLGLTLTDNGVGKVFIKRIREASQIGRLQQGLVDVGDHIEKIDNECFVGKRHYDVAKKLRSITVGTKFTIQLISPQKGLHGANKSRCDISSKSTPKIICGKRNEMAEKMFDEDLSYNDDMKKLAMDIIVRKVEMCLGTKDDEIAQIILEIGINSLSMPQFRMKIHEEFGKELFPKTVIIDFWEVISDAKDRLQKRNCHSSGTNSTQVSTSTSCYKNQVYEYPL